MSRRKVNENETSEQTKARKELEAIASNSTRAEQLVWKRKFERLNLIYDDIAPIELEIVKLINHKIPLMDKLEELRIEMSNACVHPFHFLVHCDNSIKCKFCEKIISIPKKRRYKDGTKKV